MMVIKENGLKKDGEEKNQIIDNNAIWTSF